MGGCCVSWWRVTCETRTKQPRLFPACSQSPTNPRHQATMRSTILSVLCVLCVSVGALQLPQGALSRRAAIGAAVSAVVPAAATAALVQNPYGPEALGYTMQKGGFAHPVNAKTGQVYGGVVVNNNALSAAGGLFAAVVAIGAGLAEATKPTGDEGCLISPTGAPGTLTLTWSPTGAPGTLTPTLGTRARGPV